VTKTLRVWALGLIVCGFQTGTSFAAADWLDKLSGPGPFRSYLGLTYRFLCVANAGDVRTLPELDPSVPQRTDSEGFFTWLHPFQPSAGIISVADADDRRMDAVTAAQPLVRGIINGQTITADQWKPAAAKLCQADERARGYASFTARWYKSVENNLFQRDPENPLYEVRLLDTEFAFTARLNRGLAVGGGAGVFWFSGDAFDSFRRATVTPILVEGFPVAAAGDRLKYRFIRLYGAYTMILGKLDESDFCTRGKCSRPAPFHVANEFVWRYGVDVDLAALLQFFIQ
jgi:hypothetical protein